MKYKLETPIFDDKARKALELIDQKVPQKEPTFGKLLMQILVDDGPPQERVAAEDKVKKYTLLGKVLAAYDTPEKVLELSVEDITFVKPLIDKGCLTLSHGRMMEILNTGEK